MSAVKPLAVSAEVKAAQDAEKTARDALWSQAVDVLTRSARLTRTVGDGRVVADDFAGFLAGVVSAVAANLGDVELVTAGRPGSLEADLVDQLVRVRVGWNPADLVAFRTEPVIVPLNVAALVEEAEGLVSFFDAEKALPVSADRDMTAQLAELEQLHAGYLNAYTDYARRFTKAVQAYALTIPKLSREPAEWGADRTLLVPVIVQAETSPDYWRAGPLNPVEWEGDPLVWRLWKHAFDTIGLPSIPPEVV